MEHTSNIPNQEPNKNYDLKSDAVDNLVAEETPQYSQEELNRYRTKKAFNIPEALKVVAIKTWFYGAVCYFIYWGLAMYLPGLIEMMFVLAAATGMVTDLLVNGVLHFMEKTPGENDHWMFFPQSGFKGFVLNFVYGFPVVFCVYSLYDGINRLVIAFTGQTDTIYLGVEPLLFGVFCMGFDMLFIAIKRLFGNILRDAKDAASRS